MSNEVSFCLFYPLNTLHVECVFAVMSSANYFSKLKL